MIIFSAELRIHIPHAMSLKDKRQVAKSIIGKTRHKFNLSIAEVDTQDVHQMLTIGLAIVSEGYSHGKQVMDEIIRYMEENVEGEVVEITMDS